MAKVIGCLYSRPVSLADFNEANCKVGEAHVIELRTAFKAARNRGPQSKSPQKTELCNHHLSLEVDPSPAEPSHKIPALANN